MGKEILKNISVFSGLLKEMEKGNCPTCGKQILANSFRDDLSRKEFQISGMCQECQDSVFGGAE